MSTVIVVSDWVLEQVANRTYGMCKCSWSPPHNQYDCERGFVLPTPTSMRVAAQALVLALESVEGATFIDRRTDDVVVATKHQILYSILAEAGKVDRWIATGRWPKTFNSVKTLVSMCYRRLQALNSVRPQFATLVYIEREEDDKAVVDLDENRTEQGFDMEAMTKKGMKREEIEKSLQETRMRGVMADKLLASGARCYRPKAK